MGGTLSTTAKTVTVGSTYGTLPTPSKDGYYFSGWYLYTSPPGGGIQIFSTTVVAITSDQTLYARWTGYSHIVKFDAQGGTVSPTTTGITNGCFYGNLPTPIKSGYTFGGWYTKPNGEGSEIISTTIVFVTEQQTLYAKWIGNQFTIHYNGNGSTSGSMENSTHRYSEYSNLAANAFTKDGFSFLGWATQPEADTACYLDGESVMISSPVQDDILTLYAVWSAEEVTVKFDANGGSGSLILSLLPGKMLVAPDLTRVGYTFKGWSPEVPATVPSTNMTYTAQWETVNYTITLDANGGTVSPASIIAAYGSNYGDLPVPVKEGYIFAGWWTGQGFWPHYTSEWGTEIQSTDVFSKTENQTLYANWELPTHMLTLALNDGTDGIYAEYELPIGTMVYLDYIPIPDPDDPIIIFPDPNRRYMKFEYPWPEEPHTYPIIVPCSTFEYYPPHRLGYEFLGWSEPMIYISNSDEIVNAVWYPIQTYIYFNANGGEGSTGGLVQAGTALVPPTVTRLGYTFAGWWPELPETVPEQDSTYTAEWVVNSYTITFDANGGTGGTSSNMEFDSPLTPPTVKKTGYTFTGWSPSVPAAVPAEDATYTAQWIKNITQSTIKYDLNGGRWPDGYIPPAPGGIWTIDAGSEMPDAPSPIRDGYTFAGWSPSLPATVPAGDTTYVAQWTVNHYTLNFNLNGGLGTAAVTGDYNTQVVKPPDPAKAGYTFGGWYSDAGLAAAVAWPYTIGAADVTLYAKWNTVYILGDINNNGKVSILDALITLRYVTGTYVMTDNQTAAADVDGSGTVTILDALKILQYATGLRTSF